MQREFEDKQSLASGPDDHIDEEAIRKRAYELYLDRGMGSGRALDDWFQAEKEICSKANSIREEVAA